MDIFQVIMAAVNILATIVVALLGLLLKQRDAQLKVLADQIAGMSADIKSLMRHREGCFKQFADKGENLEDHRRIWKKLDEHERALGEIKGCKGQCAMK